MDIFPMGAEHPLRIELFDNEVETIRTFDPETQLSLHKTTQVALLPAREFPFDAAGAQRFRAAFRNRFDVNLQRCALYQDAKEGIPGSGIEYYLPLFFDQPATLFDYLPARTLIVQAAEMDTVAPEALAATERPFRGPAPRCPSPDSGAGRDIPDPTRNNRCTGPLSFSALHAQSRGQCRPGCRTGARGAAGRSGRPCATAADARRMRRVR